MIFWKECRETIPLAVLSIISICLISFIKFEGWRLEFFEFQFWVVTTLCLPFVLLFLGAGAVAGERENDTFDNLIARPVSLKRIFIIKYLVRLGSLILIFPILLLIFHIIRPTHNLNLYDVTRGLVILGAFLTFCFTLAFCLSCFTETSAKAFMSSVVLICMAIFLVNNTPFFRYVWWWHNSLDELWLQYMYFYGALSLIVLGICGIAFNKRFVFNYSWKYLAVGAVLIFLFFIRSVSTTFWLIPQIAISGDVDFVQLCREPVVKILDYTSKQKKNKTTLLRQYLITSHDSRIDKELIQELSNPEEGIRNEALRVLRDRESERAVVAVLPLLSDPDVQVVHSALTFFTVLKSKDAVPDIIRLLDDSNSSIRQRAVSSLGHIQEKEALPFLMEALKDRNPRVQLAAAWQLCWLDCAEASDEVVSLMLESPYKNTRRRMASYLGHMKSAQVCDGLVEAMLAGDRELTRNVVFSLGKLQCEESVGPLVEILNDESYFSGDSRTRLTKQAIAMALKNAGGEEAKAALRELFAETSPADALKMEIAVSLVELGDDSATPFLQGFLERDTSEKKDKWINSTYATRLAKAGDYSGVPVLIRRTGEGWPEQRYKYGQTLTELTGKKYGWDTRKWEKWWEKNKDELLKTIPTEHDQI